jgi:histidinol-phosphate/aromatic aminotransferase/cobyric acid decarboxylase-like protein
LPAESGPRKPISLSRNENAYGASRQAIAAMRQAATTLGQGKPGDERKQLREAVAALHRVPADHIALSSGSSEVLRSAVTDQLRSRGRIRRIAHV